MKRVWRINWIVATAIVVHSHWGITLLMYDFPMKTTPIAYFPIHNHVIAGIVYLTASMCALIPCIWTKLDTRYKGLLLTLPQQFLLMISAWTGIVCGMIGQYPDGYVPDGGGAFIWPDQSWAIVGMFCHTFSLIDWYIFSRRSKV